MFATKKINITILIAPLDWGLGHATRCIPLINEFLHLGCKVIIAAEGVQEKLLKREFPDVDFVALPGYRIEYSKNKRFFLLKIILQLPKIYCAIKREKTWLQHFVLNNSVDAVISDNRYGLSIPGVQCVFITHQLLIKAPFAFGERILQKVNYSFIEKFTKCWIPDAGGRVNLAGVLSHPVRLPAVPVDYLGPMSRLTGKTNHAKKYDLLFIISGPEPQRSVLEKKIVAELSSFKGAVLLVRGLPGGDGKLVLGENIIVKNHLAADELEVAFSNSDLIVSRSGYTTVMDIIKLRKKVLLIPTPGQTEQEYLAMHLEEQGWCMSMSQEDFSVSKMMAKAAHFEYMLPQIDMEHYKVVVSNFVQKLCDE